MLKDLARERYTEMEEDIHMKDIGNLAQKRVSNQEARSLWNVDKRFEEISMAHIKNSSIYNDLNIKEIVTDRTRQLKGIDMISEMEGELKNIDVKAIASPLPTFCFEISGTFKTGQVGWFANDKLDTDFYLIVYHEVEGAKNYSEGKRIITMDNVNSTEAILINAHKLKRLVENEFGDLKELAKNIRDLKLEGENRKIIFNRELKEVKKGEGLLYPVLSGKLKEQPINVVIKKEFLLDNCEKHWMI